MIKKKIAGSALILFILCIVLYFVYAMYANVFGSNAVAMKGYFTIGDTEIGLVQTIQGIAALAMSIVLGLFGERINKITGLTIGLGLLALAMLLIGVMPYIGASVYILLLLFILIGGFGYVAIDLLVNGVIADVFPEQKNTLLPITHAFYGVGAMIGPQLVTILNPEGHAEKFALPYLLLGIICFVALIALIIILKKTTPHSPYADMKAWRSRTTENPFGFIKVPALWLFLMGAFLYYAFLMSMSVWLPTYLNKGGMSVADSAVTMSMFFVGSLVMRFIAPLFYKILPVKKFYTLFVLLTTVVFIVTFTVPMPSIVQRILIMLGGFLQGASVPTLIILCCDVFPERSASASAISVIAASLASLISPAVLGLMMDGNTMIPMLIATVCLPLSVVVVNWAVKRGEAYIAQK